MLLLLSSRTIKLPTKSPSDIILNPTEHGAMSILFILLIIKNSFFRHVQRTKINAKQVF